MSITATHDTSSKGRHALPALALLLLMTLSGCAARDMGDGTSPSLMERHATGKSLAPDAPGTPQRQGTPAAEAEAHLQRGLAYLAQDRPELAFEHFSRAASLAPEMVEPRLQRARLLVRRGMPNEAAAGIEAVLTASPQHARAWELAGMVAFDRGLLDEAEADFTRAITLDPDLASCYAHLGAVHDYKGRPDLARDVYAAALVRFPQSGELHNNLGVAFSMLGDDASALHHFHEAVVLGASSERSWNNMGLALCRLGRFDEAFEAFRNAGGEAAAHNNLGYFFLVNGDASLAVQHLQRAVELEPRYYVRAAENLKRARLAARFAAGGVPVPAAGPQTGGIAGTPVNKAGVLPPATGKGPGTRTTGAGERVIQ